MAYWPAPKTWLHRSARSSPTPWPRSPAPAPAPSTWCARSSTWPHVYGRGHTLLGVAQLGYPGQLIEIDLTARPDRLTSTLTRSPFRRGTHGTTPTITPMITIYGWSTRRR